MSIRVTCACGKAYHFKDEFAGRRAKCPACGQVVQIAGQRLADPAPNPERAGSPVAPPSASPSDKVPPDKAQHGVTHQPIVDLDCGRIPPESPDWLRDKPEIVEGLQSKDAVDKAWAIDLLDRYVQAGVEEAKQLRAESSSVPDGTEPQSAAHERVGGPVALPAASPSERVPRDNDYRMEMLYKCKRCGQVLIPKKRSCERCHTLAVPLPAMATIALPALPAVVTLVSFLIHRVSRPQDTTTPGLVFIGPLLLLALFLYLGKTTAWYIWMLPVFFYALLLVFAPLLTDSAGACLSMALMFIITTAILTIGFCRSTRWWFNVRLTWMRGKSWIWHVWTLILGILLFAVAANSGAVESKNLHFSDFLPAIYAIMTLVYVGLMWRCKNVRTWWGVTGGYFLCTAAVGLAILWESFNNLGTFLALRIPVGWILFTLLVIFTYSIKVRQWFRVGLGWTGPILANN